MPATDTGLRRVCVHWGTTIVDLTLPTEIPVAVLIPSIVDVLDVGRHDGDTGGYRLSVPGASGLDPSMSLAQNSIEDGAVLLLSRSTTPLPAPRFFDEAEAVSASIGATGEPCHRPSRQRAVKLIGAAAAMLSAGVGGLLIVRNMLGANAIRDGGTPIALLVAGALAVGLAGFAHRSFGDATAGLTLSVIATAFAGVAGFAAVPGAPGAPNVLLAAAAAGATSIAAMRVSGCGVVTLMAVSCCAAIGMLAALVGVISEAPLHVITAAAGLASLGLLTVAAHASIALAGLSPRLGTPDASDIEPGGAVLRSRAVRADRWLASLLTGLSLSATVAAVITVLAGAPRLTSTAFGTLTGALLLLRSRSADTARTLVFAISGIVIAVTTFDVAAVRTGMSGPWIATATTLSAAVAIFFGFVAPARPASPLLDRSAGLLEWLALAALVPLTCWICGLYGAVRGLSLA